MLVIVIGSVAVALLKQDGKREGQDKTKGLLQNVLAVP
jgi:hypothetical protein